MDRLYNTNIEMKISYFTPLAFFSMKVIKGVVHIINNQPMQNASFYVLLFQLFSLMKEMKIYGRLRTFSTHCFETLCTPF